MYVSNIKSVRQEIEKGLGTIGRIRILAELVTKPNSSFTKYALIKGTGLKRSDLKSNLAVLVSIKWVKEYKAAVYLRYQIDVGNPIVQLLYDFFKRSEYI